jgi:hypothetical protein
MAEIRVEPRQKSRGWLWLVLLLVVIAAIVYFLYVSGTFGGSATTAPDTPTAPATTPATPASPSSLRNGAPVQGAPAAAFLTSSFSGGTHGTA